MMKAWMGVTLAAVSSVMAGIVELDKTFPLVQDVDVVVVGGTAGAVAAARKAAEAGAKVFLVAPRPYLGEDMAGKLILQLDADEDLRCDLEQRMFKVTESRPASLPFTYSANIKADKKHEDRGNEALSDGKWQEATSDSVQFNQDVEYTLDLGSATEIAKVVVSVFNREGSDGFVTREVTVLGSTDAKKWLPLGTTCDVQTGESHECATLSVPLQANVRYLRIAAQKGATVSRQLLGEIYVYPANENSQTKLADRTTPLKVKRTLDEALLQAKVPFLTGAIATEPLVDASGKLSGVVIANRSGRQAVKAKVVIDATERGLLSRAAGAEASPFKAGTYTFRRIVIAGEAPRAEGVRVKELFGLYNSRVTGIKPQKGMPATIPGRMYSCEIDLPLKDGSMRSFAEAEQKARDLTFVPSQLESADTLSFLPPDHIKGQASSQAPWQGVDALDVRVFQPAGTEYLFILSPLADISRQAAEQLMKPGNLMGLGERVGVAAAKMAAQRPAIGEIKVAGSANAPTAPVAVVGEHAQGLPGYLCNTLGTVKSEPHELPVLAECDVVVAGAGTGGGPAGIAAARQGARTIVCEYIYQMGGVQTDGLIGLYYWGNRVGFTSEIDKGVKDTGVVFSQCKSEWYRQENRKSGAEIWYGTMVNGVIVENNRITGVVVLTPYGERGVIRCKAAIDATGNAELAALAGEETEFISSAEVALQGVGQTPRNMGASYTNTDFGFLDDTDAADLCFFALRSRLSMRDSVWDQAQVINSRERRRMVGALYITPLDVVNERTYPDVVVQPFSNFDSHGHTVHEQFFIEDPGHKGMKVNLPYRCMLPKKLDGLLVVGLGMSAHRDAMPILRMQPDVQNQGYAAGVAAAMSVKAGVSVRNVDMRALQRHLIDVKILPEDVLGMTDSFPLPDEKIAQAVVSLTNNYQGLGVVLADYRRSLPMLKEAFKRASPGEDRFKYAHVLGMMGQVDGEALLIDKVQGAPWDKGWNFRGMGQFNRSVSWVDSYIIALGRAKSQKALPTILSKSRELSVANEFSHFRAVAMALESIGDKSAAPVLGELLAKQGISGYAIKMQPNLPVIPNYSNEAGNLERTACLRELAVARALYRLGDCEGLGEKVLRAYAEDPRGAYAKHAKLVLAGK
jgi:flavin-dependent dehydrogenase